MFLQGSYHNETATYTINDVDIVAVREPRLFCGILLCVLVSLLF